MVELSGVIHHKRSATDSFACMRVQATDRASVRVCACVRAFAGACVRVRVRVCKSARPNLLVDSVENNVPGLRPFYSLLMHCGLLALRRRAQGAVVPTELVPEILSLGLGSIVRGGRENCTGRHRARQPQLLAS